MFYTKWSKIQLQGQIPELASAYTFNGGTAKSQGVEVAAEFRPVDDLTLSAVAAYIDAELTSTPGSGFPSASGDPLPLSSKYSASFSIDQRFHLSGATTGFVGATVAYVGDRYEAFPITPGQPQQRLQRPTGYSEPR